MFATAPPVSVIATVYQEIGSIDRLLHSLAGQTLRPSEVIVVDGGSTDGTLERLQAVAGGQAADLAWPADIRLRVHAAPGANISRGRNLALNLAGAPWVAATDAGVALEPTWLERLVAPASQGAAWVGGFFASAPESDFELALGAVTLPLADDIDPGSFLPSSRSVAFRREDALAIGGYPEWLDYCEDLIFDLRLIQRVGRPAFAPSACVRFRPRPGWRAFWTQYYRYARGDGKAGLWAGRHAIRYATYLLAIPALLGSMVRGTPLPAVVSALILAAGLASMIRRPFGRLRRSWGELDRSRRLHALALLLPLRLWGDLAKMAGYPVGLWWRRRHRPPAWR